MSELDNIIEELSINIESIRLATSRITNIASTIGTNSIPDLPDGPSSRLTPNQPIAFLDRLTQANIDTRYELQKLIAVIQNFEMRVYDEGKMPMSTKLVDRAGDFSTNRSREYAAAKVAY